jgi:DNA-binding IclR family transcriptional regulator
MIDSRRKTVPRPIAEAATTEVGVAAVNRALSILDSFTSDMTVLTLAQISQRADLYKSTILRLLQSLERFGYVRRIDGGSYVLGATPTRLAALATKSLHPAELVMPVLRELVKATSESASFYVRAGDMRLCAYRVDSPRSVRDHVHVGQLIPLAKGAGGRVLHQFDGMAADEIAKAGSQFVKVTRGERDTETAAVACPVFGAGGHLEGALSVSGPIHRFDEKAITRIRRHLVEGARELTRNFHGDTTLYFGALRN